MWIAPMSAAAIICDFESWKIAWKGQPQHDSDNNCDTFVKRLENRIRLRAEERIDVSSENSRATTAAALQRPDLLRKITGRGDGDGEDTTLGEEKSTVSKTSECIIVVGTTGTGKSSTIAKYTGAPVRVSSGPESQTRHCEIFKNNREGGGGSEAVWIDTVGYDDTNRLSDQSSFQEVLRFVDDHDLRDVRAIVWTVMPQGAIHIHI